MIEDTNSRIVVECSVLASARSLQARRNDKHHPYWLAISAVFLGIDQAKIRRGEKHLCSSPLGTLRLTVYL